MFSEQDGVITLSFGTYSNYVSTHFLNLQQESLEIVNSAYEADKTGTWSNDICNQYHGILLHQNDIEEPSGGISEYAPRAVLFDDKDGISKSLRGVLPGRSVPTDKLKQEASHSQWGGGVTVLGQSSEYGGKTALVDALDTMEKNDDVAVEEGNAAIVQGWGDFLDMRLNTRNVHVLPEVSAASTDSFESFLVGEEIFIKAEEHDRSTDKVRKWAEKCDRLQGIQCAIDWTRGWSGYASSLLEAVSDEYGVRSLFCMMMDDAFSPLYSYLHGMESAVATVNRMLTVYSLCNNLGAVIVPLRCPKANTIDLPIQPPMYYPDYSSPFHTSSVLSAWWDSVTMPLRWTAATSEKPPALSDFLSVCVGSTPNVKIVGGCGGLGWKAKQSESIFPTVPWISSVTPGVGLPATKMQPEWRVYRHLSKSNIRTVFDTNSSCRSFSISYPYSIPLCRTFAPIFGPVPQEKSSATELGGVVFGKRYMLPQLSGGLPTSDNLYRARNCSMSASTVSCSVSHNLTDLIGDWIRQAETLNTQEWRSKNSLGGMSSTLPVNRRIWKVLEGEENRWSESVEYMRDVLEMTPKSLSEEFS